MPTLNLLYKHEIEVNDQIKIYIPTVGEILEAEDNYYGMIHNITAMPIDMMVALDDVGVDFTTINEYDLFLLLFDGLKIENTKLVFGDLDLSGFSFYENSESKMTVLYDKEKDIMIDRAIYEQIAEILRTMHHLEKNIRKPANKQAKDFMIERARIKAKRRQRKKKKIERSDLESLIISMVNTEQFKYKYDEVLDLTIYQFNESVRQIIHKVEYDNINVGIYTGNIDSSKLPKESLNWLSN